ncbi:MAG: extracellular solute-binding protein [bacterium]
MAKFPDPTRDYKGEPISTSLDLSQPAQPVQPSTSTEPTQLVVNQQNTQAPTTPSQPDPSPTEVEPIVEPEPVVPAAVVTPLATDTVPSDPPAAPLPVKTKLTPSPFRNLIPIIIGVGVLALLTFLGFQFLPGLFKKEVVITNINYWGLWEPSSVMQGVIADYQAKNPAIKIVYTMQSPKNYRARLQTAIQQGNGPDIARIHNTWLPVLRKNLSSAPETIISPDILANYYPVVTKDLVQSNKIYAMPLMIDGLALYYNESILNSVGQTPPSDWNGLRKLAYDLTIRNPDTKIIERAGIAMGTTNNIDHWSDILGLLILQNSGTPAKPSSQAVQDAITFFTTFSTQDKIWDATQPNDIYAFATGTVAMILAPSWQAPAIAAINPDLKFKIVPAPTLPETKTAWATYWAEAVPSSSKNQTEAWKFISYLSTPEVMQKLYASEAQIRPIGEVYPRTDMASLLSTDPVAGAFVNQAENYTSWYLARKTYDEAINDELIKYYEDTVNAVNQGTPVDAVLNTLESGVAQVLAKYPEAK